MELFRRAGAGNAPCAQALNNLGLCVEEGLGTAPSVADAAALYELAATLGFAPAALNLGCAWGGGGLHLVCARARVYTCTRIFA